MSYVRSRQHRGMGQFAPGAPMTSFDTSQPSSTFTAIQPQGSAPVPMIMAQFAPPPTPTEPIDPGSEDFTTPNAHRAPPAVQQAFISIAMDPAAAEKFMRSQLTTLSAEKAKCSAAGGIYTPDGSECDVDSKGNLYNCRPASAGATKKYYCIPDSAKGGSVSMANQGSQPINAFSSGGSSSSGGSKPVVDATKTPVSVTPAQFAAACQQVNGKMGSNCCKLPNGAAVGISNGQLVQISECSAGMGSIPLIAGAAVAALLLMRIM